MTIIKSKVLFPSIFLLLSVYYTLPYLLKYDYWGIRDWDLFTTIAAVPVSSLLHYGQFPFWNPYLGGGNILFHHPEVAVLSPFLLLYLIFGAVVGLKLQVLVCYFLGFWGSHRLATKFGISKWVALVTTVAYFGSVHFAMHFTEGHTPFTHFCFLPWFLYFIITSVDRKGDIAMASLVLALMILGNGAAIPLLYTLTFSAVLFGLRFVQNRSINELGSLFFSILGGIGLAAVKFVPMVLYMMQIEWKGRAGESIPISALWSIFFGLDHSLFIRNFPEQFWRWHEYGSYISPLLVIFAIIALLAVFRRRWVWLVIAVFFLLLGLGDFGAYSPWRLLSHLPGFSSARCTGRSFQFVLLAMSILGGFGLDWTWQKVRQFRWPRLSGAILITVATVIITTNLVMAWPIMNQAFRHEPKDIQRSPVFGHIIDRVGMTYEYYLANRGSLISNWLSATPPSRALVTPDDSVMMENVLTGQADIKHRDYTPNKITYEIEGHSSGEMAISMGYDPGWQATDGRPLREENNLIAFPFEQGHQQVVLRYRPPGLVVGIVISSLTLVCLVWFRRRRIVTDSD
ncbi:MAG: YfhO family protein [bacterium]